MIFAQDSHIETLVKRCNKLKVLDLSMTKVTKKSLPDIVNNLNLLEELDMRNYHIFDEEKDLTFELQKLILPPNLMKFSFLKKTKANNLNSWDQECLKRQLPNLKKITVESVDELREHSTIFSPLSLSNLKKITIGYYYHFIKLHF